MKLRLTLLLLHLFLYSTNSFCQLDSIDPSMEHTYWNFLRAKILPPNAYAARFETDIKVQLVGDFTHLDSLSINNNIKEIRQLIKTVNIELTDSLGNIILTLANSNDNSKTLIHKTYDSQSNKSIVLQEYRFTLYSSMSQKNRNKNLRYYLFRALTKVQQNPNGDTVLYSSIFQEKEPENSDIIEVDKFIIQKLYSPDFYDQFKSNFHGSKYDYIYYRYENNIKLILKALGLLIGFIVLLLLLKYKLTSIKNNNWSSYIKQGLLIINFIFIFNLISQNISGYYWLALVLNLKLLVSVELLLIILLSCLYYIENLVSNEGISIRLIVQIITTTLFTYVLFISLQYVLTQSSTNIFKTPWSWSIQLKQIIAIISTVCIRLIFNFVNFKNIQELRIRDLELTQIKGLKTKAELQALHSRINPHFLYNSLNSIAALAHINPAKTEHMALALSDFFRYAINHKDQDMIEVEKEVDIARTYLQIEKARFEDDLEFTIEIDNSIQTTLIPRFLIQPLIENAVKHGVSVIQEKGIIQLEISKQEENLLVRVFDNGPDFPNMPISGYGLQSLYEKLELLYGESAKISWENQPDKNICIRLPFTPKSV
ncbi:histidine kinase [Ancylomarina sp. DW003]|nr:histidine kinase [Ancylomarina sp. DW003]MDE5423528.1 histidine kinase [Ancylomarina sp. DW003]